MKLTCTRFPSFLLPFLAVVVLLRCVQLNEYAHTLVETSFRAAAWRHDGTNATDAKDAGRRSGERRGALDVLEFPPPLTLELQNLNMTAALVSAILQEDVVVFVVYDTQSGPGECGEVELLELPPGEGFGCRFDPDEQDNGGNSSSVTTPLTVNVTCLAYKKTSSIWMCPLPDSYRQVSTPPEIVVDVVTPSWVKRSGRGRFTFAPGADENWEGNVVSCGKNIYDWKESTKRTLEDHYAHYRGIGVDKFVWYVIDDKDRAPVEEALSAMHEHVTLILIPTETIDVFRSFRRYRRREAPLFRVQSYTTNDCLYRAKASGIPWVMMMFDMDELLVGTDNLPATLSRGSKDSLYVRHHHVHPEDTAQMMHRNETIRISSRSSSDLGKSIFKTDKVDSAWVHYPNAPRISKGTLRNFKLLHFSPVKSARKFPGTKWTNFSLAANRSLLRISEKKKERKFPGTIWTAFNLTANQSTVTQRSASFGLWA